MLPCVSGLQDLFTNSLKVSNLLNLAMRLAMIGFAYGPVRLEAFLLKLTNFTETNYNMKQRKATTFEVSN